MLPYALSTAPVVSITDHTSERQLFLMTTLLTSSAVTVKPLPEFNSMALLLPEKATLMSAIVYPIVSEATWGHSLTTFTVIVFLLAFPG